MVEIVRGGSPRPIKDYLTSEVDGINWIKIGDTEKGEKYINNVKEKIKKSGLNKTRFVKKGTFLLTNSMSFGRPYILNVDGAIHDGWLIDTVLLTKIKNYCLLVLTDRRSRHQIIRLIPNKTAESVNQALTLLLGEHRILSITADNGSEFKRLSEVFPEEHIYYAHAYSSWERGSNENHNRLIRRWLPKGTKKTTPKEVAFIENWINNYPKKCLDYKSPSEFLLGG
ncbi:transposase-like protein, IS1239 [Streptococcus pneumoniae]|nr:transposase-like protein, IS1239 [Streptococcus pneumoniae]